MNNKFTLTQKLTKKLIDLTVKNKSITPIVKYNGGIFKSNSNINFKVISALKKEQNVLYNTLRYIDIELIKNSCFEFSDNIPDSSIIIKAENYNINNNKILVESLSSVSIPVSAYAEINNKEYYLTNTTCKVQNYYFDILFNNKKLIIPKDFSFSYFLRDFISKEESNYPNDLFSTKISILHDIFNNINSSLNINENSCENLLDLLLQILTGKLNYYIYSKELEKYYNLESIDKNIYIVSTNCNNQILLSKEEFYDLFYKNLLSNKDNIIFNAPTELRANINHKILSTGYYSIKENNYYNTLIFNEINNVILKENVYCEDILINLFNVSAYIYSKPIIKKSFFTFLLKKLFSIPISCIVNYPEDDCLTNNIKYNNKDNITEIYLSENNASALIEFEKQTINGNKQCIQEVLITSKYFDVINDLTTSFILLNGNNYLLNAIHTTDYTLLLEIENNNLDYFDILLSSNTRKEYQYNNLSNLIMLNEDIELENNYLYYTNIIKTKQNDLINTLLVNYNLNIYAYIDFNKELLSSITHNIYCYGKFINLAKNNYTILNINDTKNLYTNNLKNTQEYILDPCLPFDIFVLHNYEYDSDNIFNLSYIEYNIKLNNIKRKDITYNDIIQLKKDLDKNKLYFIKFKDKNNNYIKYIVCFKHLFNLPGKKEFKCEFNDNVINISKMADLYNRLFLLLDNNILKINDEIITFNKFLLNIPNILKFLFNIKGNKFLAENEFKLILIDELSAITHNYEYNIKSNYLLFKNGNIISGIKNYGRYESPVSIIPKNLFNTQIILNFKTKEIIFNYRPDNFLFLPDSVNGIYYGEYKNRFYGCVKIDAGVNLIDGTYKIILYNVFSNINVLDYKNFNINYDYIEIKENCLLIKAKDVYNKLPKTIYINTVYNNIIAILDIILENTNL